MADMSVDSNEYTGYEDQDFTFHPYNILLTLLLASLAALFLSFTVAYVYTRVDSGIPATDFPWIFIINTIILIASSFVMYKARQYYLEDNTKAYKNSILLTFILSLVFLAGQAAGWIHLFEQKIYINSDNSAAYLYLISGLHFLHVIGGLPFLLAFYITAVKKMKEPHTVLIYFTNPEKRLKLKLLTRYWHFLDIMWVYLVLFFMVNEFIN